MRVDRVDRIGGPAAQVRQAFLFRAWWRRGKQKTCDLGGSQGFEDLLRFRHGQENAYSRVLGTSASVAVKHGQKSSANIASSSETYLMPQNMLESRMFAPPFGSEAQASRT